MQRIALPGPFTHLVAAGLAETVACVIYVPTEVVKQRLQVAKRASIHTVVSRVMRTEGIRGMYRGFGATLQREVPFVCMQFPLYEWLKSIAAKNRAPLSHTVRADSSIDRDFTADNKPSPFVAGVCGAIAGAATGVLTTPLDVAKTRIVLAAASTIHQPRFRPWRMLPNLWREGGVRLLFAGAFPRATSIGVGGLLFFGVYESIIAL